MKINEVIKVDVNSISLDPNNPNVMEEEEMNRLRKSMKVYGYLTPLVIDQNNMIVDGEHRYTIFREYNIDKIPCIKLVFKSEAERRALRQVMNKLSGTHDLEKDIKELELIIENDPELLEELVGMTQDDLDDMKSALDGVEPQFRSPDNDDINDIEEKHVIHIPVSEELLSKLEQIKKQNDIKEWEDLLIWFISQVNIN